MANLIDPGRRFHARLGAGQAVEADGSTVTDPVSGAAVPAVLLRMTPERARELADVLDDWCRVAAVFTTLHGSEAAERVLAWTLATGASALGAPGSRARDPQLPVGPTARQRLAAVTVLSDRERRMSPVQRIAVVDAAARWLSEEAGDELCRALLGATCSEAATANFAYLALITPPESAT